MTTEMFSSLMTAPNDSLTDAAGTALVSISTVTPSVHIMVVFTGILSGKRKNDNLLLLRLFAEEKPTAIFEEVSRPLIIGYLGSDNDAILEAECIKYFIIKYAIGDEAEKGRSRVSSGAYFSASVCASVII